LINRGDLESVYKKRVDFTAFFLSFSYGTFSVFKKAVRQKKALINGLCFIFGIQAMMEEGDEISANALK